MEAVIFDFFGTLNDPRAESERRNVFSATAAVLGIEAEVFWHAMSTSFPQRIIGVYGGTLDTLRAVSAMCGVSPSDKRLQRATEVHIAGSASLHRTRAGALEALDALRAMGFTLGLSSDCSSELCERWPETPYADRIQAPVFSWRQGYRKPDPRMYVAAAQGLGVSASRCVYVGDGGAREHQGARAAGMTPILVTNASAGGCVVAGQPGPVHPGRGGG